MRWKPATEEEEKEQRLRVRAFEAIDFFFQPS